MDSSQRHKAIISLGSNHEQQANLDKALLRIGALLSDAKQSQQLWTMPIGICSDRFLNMMVSGYTSLTLNDFASATKAIEADCGRTVGDERNGRVRMDIDIMEFDGQRFHCDDWNREYINTLSKEI